MHLFKKDRQPADPKRTGKIGREEVRKWNAILLRYKAGKEAVESRAIENEQWWRQRSWDYVRPKDKDGKPVTAIEPRSAWLVNFCTNKEADLVENYPAPTFRPRERGDTEEANRLTAIVPVILRQAGYEKVYRDVVARKIRHGTGITKVCWDPKRNGIGDVGICKVEVLNIFTQPGETDVQKSRYVFEVSKVENDLLEAEYPQLVGKLKDSAIEHTTYIHDDSVDLQGFSLVKEVYYKRPNKSGKTVVHYAKWVGEELLYASENEKEWKERGFYDHGLYPYVFDPCFEVIDSPFGTGYIDRGKSPQEYIDKSNAAILKNLLVSASPRVMYREDGGIDPNTFTDLTRDAIPVQGSLDEAHVRFVPMSPFNGSYITIIRDKIEEMKETLGNRDVSVGGTSGGVTAASGIAAQQEASGKESRLLTRGTWSAFEQIVYIIVELIRQFYDESRQFRITGENGEDEYVEYSNAALKGSSPENYLDVEGGFRKPEFDIEVGAQKSTRYTQLAQNELALQLYGQGFFRPDLADQALAALEVMDFDGKTKVVDIVHRNQTLSDRVQMLEQQLMTLAMEYDAHRGTGVAQGLAGTMGSAEAINRKPPSSEGKKAGTGENKIVENARARAAQTTEPR